MKDKGHLPVTVSAVIAAFLFVAAGVLFKLGWAATKHPTHDYLITRIKAPASPLPLQRARLLTPRLVLLAAAKADAYWGGTRCTSITFDFKALGDSRIAEAQWETNSGSSDYSDCHITFNTDPTKIKTTFWHYCAAVVHEFGHLSGHGHVPNRNNIMFASLSEHNTPATCKQLVYP